MRIKISLPFLLVTIGILQASIPSGYYNGAEGLSGSALRQALHDIIDDHIVLSYDDIWVAYQTTDMNTNGKIWDMYTGIEWTYLIDQQGYDGDMDVYTNYNREHSWPKSWANETSPHYTDLNHLYPVQAYSNSHRNNLPYGEVETGLQTYTSENGTLKGPARPGLGYEGTVFEPIDEYKGDLARTYFYMSTRYYGEDSAWDSVEMAIGCELQEWALNMLLDWNELDPVSQKETDRNDAVYALQGNRNPFIDHPEYVDSIWTSTSTGMDAPAAQSASDISHDRFTANWSSVYGATGYKLYVSEYADFGSYLTGYGPKDVGNVNNETILSLSPSTTYYYRVRAYDSTEESGNSNTVSVTTSSVGTPTNGSIFFSEYIEGSSYNKALEIYNISGAGIDLADVTIITYSNGSPDPSYTLTLSGNLDNNGVYVLCHTSANASIQAVADLLTGGVTNFNGNDAIELYYQNELVDVLGTVGSSIYFATDVTLVRKSNITEGNSVFTLSEWDSYGIDESSYLGSHTVSEQALPISLLSFEASIAGDHVELTWITASEVENNGFMLFKNNNYLVWIDGAGTSTDMNVYSFNDPDVEAGETYIYRIEDLDYAGNINAHEDKVVRIRVPEDTEDIAIIGELFPNPFNPFATLPVTLARPADLKICLYDIKGKRVATVFNGHMLKGRHAVPVDASDLSSGVYFIELSMDSQTYVQKFMLAK